MEVRGTGAAEDVIVFLLRRASLGAFAPDAEAAAAALHAAATAAAKKPETEVP